MSILLLTACAADPRDPALGARTLDCITTIATDHGSYTMGDDIVVSWDCTPGDPDDWIAIGSTSGDCGSKIRYFSTGGVVMDSQTFAGELEAGTYYAQAWSAGTCTLLAEQSFTVVAGTPSVTTDSTTYGAMDHVTISWTGMPGGATDYVGVTRPGLAAGTLIVSAPTGGTTTGSVSYDVVHLGSGMFTARAYRGGTSNLLASSTPFAVMGPMPTVETDRTTYAYRDPIGVSWTNFSSYLYDLILIVRSPPVGFRQDFFYYDIGSGVRAGTASWHVPLPPGAYLLQAFDDAASLVAQSVPFTVTGPGPTISLSEIVAPSTSIPVTFQGVIDQSANAYVALLGAGPTPPAGASQFVNTDSGTVTFEGLVAGRYRAELHDWFGPPSIDHLLATQDFVVTSDTSCEAGTLPIPDGSTCSSSHACFEGSCLPLSGTCGDGVRNGAASPREGCDDGYHDAGDACDATCEPTALVVASRGGLADRPAGQLPAVAEDGTGRLLFVWLSERVVAGEPTRDLVARRYTSAGHILDEQPIVLEPDVGSSAPVRPSVVGLSSGWAVAWRSTRIEPAATGEQGGIALSIVPRGVDAGAGRPVLVNETTARDQLDPTLAAYDGGLAVVWTDFSSEITTGDLRLRFASAAGTPLMHEQAVATTGVGDQSRAFAVGRGSAGEPGASWAVAWTTRGAAIDDLPEVHLRRFVGQSAADASEVRIVAATGTAAWASDVALAPTPNGYLAAWTARGSDSAGDIGVRYLVDGTTPANDSDVHVHSGGGTLAHAADTAPAIAAFPVAGAMSGDPPAYVVAYSTAAGFGGGRVDASVTLPAESTALRALLTSGESAYSLVPTTRGLWATWADPGPTSSTDAFVAYLLPYD